MNSLCTQFYVQANVLCVRMCSLFTSHIWARDNPCVVRIMWASNPLQRQHFGCYRRGHYCWPCTPNRVANCSFISQFARNRSTDALTDMFQATRQILWYYRDGPAAHYGQDVLLWLKSAYSGRWSGRGVVAWPSQSLDVASIEFFLWAHLTEHFHTFPHMTSITWQDQPAVTTIATKESNRLRKYALLRTVVGREMDGGDFESLL